MSTNKYADLEKQIEAQNKQLASLRAENTSLRKQLGMPELKVTEDAKASEPKKPAKAAGGIGGLAEQMAEKARKRQAELGAGVQEKVIGSGSDDKLEALQAQIEKNKKQIESFTSNNADFKERVEDKKREAELAKSQPAASASGAAGPGEGGAPAPEAPPFDAPPLAPPFEAPPLAPDLSPAPASSGGFKPSKGKAGKKWEKVETSSETAKVEEPAEPAARKEKGPAKPASAFQAELAARLKRRSGSQSAEAGHTSTAPKTSAAPKAAAPSSPKAASSQTAAAPKAGAAPKVGAAPKAAGASLSAQKETKVAGEMYLSGGPKKPVPLSIPAKGPVSKADTLKVSAHIEGDQKWLAIEFKDGKALSDFYANFKQEAAKRKITVKDDWLTTVGGKDNVLYLKESASPSDPGVTFKGKDIGIKDGQIDVNFGTGPKANALKIAFLEQTGLNKTLGDKEVKQLQEPKGIVTEPETRRPASPRRT